LSKFTPTADANLIPVRAEERFDPGRTSTGLRPPSPAPVGEGQEIVFAGERFDAVSVQNWRKKALK
jgi:hypothetical protein